MTKYVLNSGGIKHKPALKSKFHLEIIKDQGNKPKILLCNFGQGREYWEAKFKGYADNIKEDMPIDVQPSFELALPDVFVKQCKNSDIIYFHGGDDYLTQFWMKKFDLAEIFKDKIVASNSGSSDMLVSSFWTCDWRHCMDGLGLLPIKFIPHYLSGFGDNDPRGPIDWQKAYNELSVYGDISLPIHALKEGDFIVIGQ